MKEEIWKDIVGYEGLYQVSNMGRVRSLDRKRNCGVKGSYVQKGRILKYHITTSGYCGVRLSDQHGKMKDRLIHCLVAQAFLPNPLSLPELNHKDENKLHNYASNLEWCTRQYNINYGDRTHKAAVSESRRPVLQYSFAGDFIQEYYSAYEAVRNVLGSSVGGITGCCKGRGKQSGGYIWRYKEEIKEAS